MTDALDHRPGSRRRSLVTVAVLVAASLAAPRAAAEPTLALSEAEAVARALASHPALAAAERAIEAAGWRKSQTLTAWIPRLKIESSYVAVGPLQTLEIDTGITPPGQPGPVVISREMGSVHNAAVGVTIGWRAFEAGARQVRTEAAEALERAARAEADEQAVQIAYAVRGAYLAARFFQEVEANASRSLALADRELAEQEALKKAGLGDDLEVARVRVRVADLGAQRTRAEQERLRATAALRLLVGIEAASPISLRDDLAGLGAAPLPRAAAQSHPTRRRTAAAYDAIEREHERLGRTYFPTIDLFANVKYQYPESYFTSDQAGFVYSAGAALSWNVLDGDLTRRQRGEAEANMAAMAARGEAADREIRRKLADAEAKARTAEAAVEAGKRTLAAAEVYVRAARAALESGTGTALELSKATEATDQAELGLLKAYFEGALAHADYLAAAGLTGVGQSTARASKEATR